jgi:hypothetical protein
MFPLGHASWPANDEALKITSRSWPTLGALVPTHSRGKDWDFRHAKICCLSLASVLDDGRFKCLAEDEEDGS